MQHKGIEKFLIFGLLSLLFVFGVQLGKTEEKNERVGTHFAFLDVGQGDATLVTTVNRKHVLIDGGPDKKILSALSEELLPTERRIDAIILTHPHADHVVGLNYVLERYDVGTVYLTGSVHPVPEYLEFLETIKEKNIQAQKAYLGQDFELDGTRFSFRYPANDLSGVRPKDQNDTSVVTTVEYAGSRALLLGDLSSALQNKYLGKVGADGTYSILKVSHHGSKTGTSTSLLERIRPEYSIISVAKDNYYGLPADRTMSQLAGSKVLRTDRDGTIRFMFSKDGATLD